MMDIHGYFKFNLESIEELREMVLPLFSDVTNKEVEKPYWPEHPYGPDEVKVCTK